MFYNAFKGKRVHTTSVLISPNVVSSLLRARSNWRRAVAVTLPITGESNKRK